MVEPRHILLQVLSLNLPILGKVDACLSLAFACNKMCTEQFCQLKEEIDAFIGKAIEPFLHDSFRGCRKISTLCVAFTSYTQICLMDIHMIVKIRGPIKGFHLGHSNFVETGSLYDLRVKGVETNGKDPFQKNHQP